MTLSKLVNDEQLLDLALYVITTAPDYDKEESYYRTAEEIAVFYAMQQIDDPDDDKKLYDKYVGLCASFILARMVKKDLLVADFNENGEVVYNKTEFGKMVADEYERQSGSL